MAENPQSDDTHRLLQGLVREQLGLVRLQGQQVSAGDELPMQFTPAGHAQQEALTR